MNAGEDYVIGRSLIRCEEFKALNTRVPEPVVNSIKLWLKIERAREKRPIFIMLEHYSDVLLMMETILQLSWPL